MFGRKKYDKYHHPNSHSIGFRGFSGYTMVLALVLVFFASIFFFKGLISMSLHQRQREQSKLRGPDNVKQHVASNAPVREDNSVPETDAKDNGAEKAVVGGRYNEGGHIHIIQQYVVLDGVKTKEEERLKKRQAEYVDTLQKNIDHPLVAGIHLLLEKPEHAPDETKFRDPNHKVATYLLGKRINYRDGVKYANENLQGKVVVLTNADIFVGDGWDLVTSAKLGNSMFAPARYENASCRPIVCGNGVCDCVKCYGACHDTFAFVPPLPDKLTETDIIDFRFGGLWGSENVFLYEVREAGVPVSNPCLTVKVHHNHCSAFRPTQDQRNIYAGGRAGGRRQGIEVPVTALD